MKSISILSRQMLAFATALSGVVILASCEKDNDNNDNPPGQTTYTISGSASGAQEVPAVTTGGSGTISGTYNANSNVLVYSIDWNTLSGDASMAHFHGPAEPGVTAGVLLPINIITNGAVGAANDSIKVSDDFETALLAGKVYYNVHTLANPEGEIRGQITTTKN